MSGEVVELIKEKLYLMPRNGAESMLNKTSEISACKQKTMFIIRNVQKLKNC